MPLPNVVSFSKADVTDSVQNGDLLASPLVCHFWRRGSVVQQLAVAVNLCVNPDCTTVNAKEILIVPQADEQFSNIFRQLA